jgi:hypothetical protein
MRDSIPRAMQLRVWYRDNWHCTYCGDPIFFSPTLKLLDSMSPGHGYYDRHGKRGAMIALLENLCACCDHVTPVAAGGENSLANLVAACFACNRAKSSGEPPRQGVEPSQNLARPERWDGLASLYLKLPGADAQWCLVIKAEQPSICE